MESRRGFTEVPVEARVCVWQKVKQKAEDLGCGVGWGGGSGQLPVWPCQGQTGTGFRWVMFISVLKLDSVIV